MILAAKRVGTRATARAPGVYRVTSQADHHKTKGWNQSQEDGSELGKISDKQAPRQSHGEAELMSHTNTQTTEHTWF